MQVVDISELALTIFASVGGASIVIVGMAALLGRIWADRLAERDKARSQIEIERLKAVLGVYGKRLETEHVQLFAKRVEIMENTFHRLIEIKAQAERSLWFVEAPTNPTDIRGQARKLHGDIRSLWQYFEQNRIYVEEDICACVGDAIAKGSIPATRYLCFLGNYDDHELNSIQDVRDGAWDEIERELKPAIDLVERRFRSIVLAHVHSDSDHYQKNSALEFNGTGGRSEAK